MTQTQTLAYIINHVFLPPKLLEEDDSGVDRDFALIEECTAAWKMLQVHLPSHEGQKWVACTRMLEKMLKLRDPSGDIISGKIVTTLDSIAEQGIFDRS